MGDEEKSSELVTSTEKEEVSASTESSLDEEEDLQSEGDKTPEEELSETESLEEGLPEDEELFAEEERIGQEINDLENGLSDSKKPKEEEIQLNIITDTNEQLKFMEYGEELLIPQKTNEGYTLVHSSKNKLERNFYDFTYRLIKKEVWDYKDYESAKLKESYTYQYLDDSLTLVKTILDEDQNQTIYEYGAEGLLDSVNKYYCQDEEKYLISEKHILYYDDKKIAEEESKEYFYTKNYKKITDTFQKEYKYFYNDEGIPPDFEYLENGVLKMKNKYSSEKGTYTSQTFFSADVSVKSYYENNFRIKDVYYNKDRVVRVRNYEKNDISEF